MNVTLVNSMGDDTDVVRAAKVSTQGVNASAETYVGLINYLMRNRHMSPFEHVVFTFKIEAPIFVAREFMRHRTQSINEECLAGDTIITRMTKDGHHTYKKNSKIADMYKNWHEGVTDTMGRTRHLASCKNIYVRSFNETTRRPEKSKVINIVKSTGKTTWLVTTESGKQIRSSMKHKYFTPDGWRCLSQLKVGDYVYRSGLVRVDGEPIVPPRLRQDIQIWTSQFRPHIIPTHGANCCVCEKHLGYNEVELDHVVPVVVNIKLALDRDNIEPICKQCHRKKSNFEQRYASRGVNGSIRADKIVSITDPLQEDTYDLILEGPHHNFLANGIMVHNSGRYKVLENKFYYPHPSRPLKQIGKTSEYKFDPEFDDDLFNKTIKTFRDIYGEAWKNYQNLLDDGVAKEVARMILPVGIYTTWFSTMNARNLMHFLDLRLDPTAQWEIRQVANMMEDIFKQQCPVIYEAWRGRNDHND